MAASPDLNVWYEGHAAPTDGSGCRRAGMALSMGKHIIKQNIMGNYFLYKFRE
jgi:hypothetical protein